MNESNEARGGGMFWAFVPVGLLGSMLVGLGSLAYIAIDDPGFALEPNYYDKAVHWDRSQAEVRESAALGYQLELNPLVLSADGSASLELSLRDRAGAPLVGASVTLEAFPNAAASHLQQPVMREVLPGVYRGSLARAARGLWELRCNVSHQGSHYRQVLRRVVVKRTAA